MNEKGRLATPKKDRQIYKYLIFGRKKKHLIFGFLFILFAVFFLVVFGIAETQKTSITLLGSKNRFKVNFDVPRKDKEKFLRITKGLGLPESVQEGVEFELDATSSATLSFFLPIEAKLTIKQQKIDFRGSLDLAPLNKKLPRVKVKIPISTNLAVYAEDFINFIQARLDLPSELQDWLVTNLFAKKGQLMVIFGQSADFAIIAHSEAVDFETLKNIQTAGVSEPVYKKDRIDESVELHLFKVKTTEEFGGRELTVTFFKMDQWLFFTSSHEAAQELVNAYKSRSPSLDFDLGSVQTVSMAVLYRNPEEGPIGEVFSNIVFGKESKPFETIKKVDSAKFILKADRFSGLINLK